jgi:hypothetical protein
MASNVTRDHHRWTRDIKAPQDTTINVTGILTLDSTTGICKITDSTAGTYSPQLLIESTDASGYGPVLNLKQDSATPASDDILGTIYFSGDDDGGTLTTYASIEGFLEDPTNTGEEGTLKFSTCAGNVVLRTGLELTGGASKIDVGIGYGTSSLTTIAGDLDIDGDTITTAGNITLDAATDIILKPQGNNVKISANTDGSHALDIANDGSGNFTIKADRGTDSDIKFTNSADIEICRIDGGVPGLTFGGNESTYLEGGNDLNIHANRQIAVHRAIGFNRITATDATNVEIDFTAGHKAHLDMTGGSISGTLTLKFPGVSGNFVLVVQQDSSTRTINAFATKDISDNAGNNDGGTAGAIRWAGGSAPDLTDGGNKRDILSFYWDATEEVCYGTASLNF